MADISQSYLLNMSVVTMQPLNDYLQAKDWPEVAIPICSTE